MVDKEFRLAIPFDYSRGGRHMSLRRAWVFLRSRTIAGALGLLAAIPVAAQYPGQITKNSKDAPELRAIAVLEWTGDAGKPKSSRLVPVAVLDQGTLQDGGIYLARPQPLALSGEVEYELDQDGKPVGLYDIKNAGQEQGSWVGYGSWKPMPVAKAKRPALDLAKLDDDAQSDEPVLHRKHHAGDAPASGKSGGGADSGTGSGAPAADDDPDRPKLHRSPTSDSSSAGTAGSAGTTTSTNSSSGSDEPTMHRKDSSSESNGNAGSASGTASGSNPSESTSSSHATDDPDRPVLKKTKKKAPEDVAHVDSLPDDADPDRPRLKRGRADGYALNVVPSLMGLPADMQQAVAVSDAKTHPEHPWDFQWSNPDDETKMKTALEDMARDALGLKPPAPPPAKKTTVARRTAKPAAPPPPVEPVPLEGEKFRVFELSYGSGATMVLTAHTDGPLAQQKFVTLVAQPDLYGNVLVLLKSVTDGTHLDEKPRMRLVDAVDAMADNRGELLFELRGATQRQFALYRVLRGQAEKLFVSGGGEFGVEASE
jgi:hypothetical protein